MKIVSYLTDRNPFKSGNGLMNISIGEVYNKTVGVYQAKEISETLISSLKDLSVFDYSFKKKDTAVTLPTNHLFQLTMKIYLKIRSFCFRNWW